MGEIKRDTAIVGPRQWYIEDYSGPTFSTKADAQEALRLSNHMMIDDRKNIWAVLETAFVDAGLL